MDSKDISETSSSLDDGNESDEKDTEYLQKVAATLTETLKEDTAFKRQDRITIESDQENQDSTLKVKDSPSHDMDSKPESPQDTQDQDQTMNILVVKNRTLHTQISPKHLDSTCIVEVSSDDYLTLKLKEPLESSNALSDVQHPLEDNNTISKDIVGDIGKNPTTEDPVEGLETTTVIGNPVENAPEVPSTSRGQEEYLISEEILEALERSPTAESTELHGSQHPRFFQGTLTEAINEAFQKRAKHKKMLALYLHHDSLPNAYRKQLLFNDSVVSYLTSNFIVWGCDITTESNMNSLLISIEKNLQTTKLVETIRNIEFKRYPVIIFVSKFRTATETTKVIYCANTTLSDLTESLNEMKEIHDMQRKHY